MDESEALAVDGILESIGALARRRWIRLIQPAGSWKPAGDEDIELPKKIKLKRPQKVQIEIQDDPNVLGFDQHPSSSSSESEESESEHEIIEDNVTAEPVKTPEEPVEQVVEQVKQVKVPLKEEVLETFVNVPVHRTAEVIESRSKLPIIGEEHTIIDAIRHHCT